jgi:hypothetical protein
MRHLRRLEKIGRGLAVGSLFLGLAVGCGRTGLGGSLFDGAVGSGGAHLGGATVGSGGASSNGGLTSVGGSRADGTTGSGGAHLGGTTGSGGSATFDAGCVPPPAPSCVPGPATATVLNTYDNSWDVVGLATSGEHLFIATNNNDRTSAQEQGRITRIALRTKAMDTQEVSGDPIGLRYAAGAAIYRPATRDPNTTWDFYAPTVTRWSLQTGETATLPNPTDFPSSSLGPLAGNGKGEVFWSLSQDGRTAIAKWDPCTGKSSVLLAGRDAVTMFADDTSVYWHEPKGGRGADFAGHTLLYAMPTTAGATPTLLVDETMYSWNGPGLLAIDRESLYYLDDMAPHLGVLAVPKRGGDKHSVIPDADPLRLDSSTIDDTHIYWVGFDDQSTLRRTSKQGGATESVWSMDKRLIQVVAVDACNVYWVASNPTETFYRAK